MFKHRIFLSFLCILFSTNMANAQEKLTLSLNEAILLSVRSNPNVLSSRLNYVIQKFNLHVQEWQFDPHYSFEASATSNRQNYNTQFTTGDRNYNISPGVSLQTPIGTQLSLVANNPVTNHYNPGLSLQIMQPLMRGFGKAVVEAALYDAKDTEVISRLSIEGVMRNTVSAVINAYLDLMSAERALQIDQEAVKRATHSVEQTKIFIKAGHKAGNELVTVQATVASSRAQVQSDYNNLQQARYALLSAIGMDPNTEVSISKLDVPQLIQQYHSPSLSDTKQRTLENDIQYQIDRITLHGPTTRNLLLAEDNTRWQLNLTASATTGSGGGGGKNAGVNSLFNGSSESQTVSLNLQIPIDDQVAKQGVLNAKIALKQAELALSQEKWSKETNAINGWNLVSNARQAMRYAEDAEKLQERTYHISYQKYLHGLIDSLELQSAQIQLIQAQQTLLAAQVNYVKSLVNLDLLIGHTLKTWDIKARLS